MRFALTSFFQEGTYRVFCLEGLPLSEGLCRYWVKADMDRVIDAFDAVPGPSPNVYAFSRVSVQRNLFRISLP
jgi:hypothetical protein